MRLLLDTHLLLWWLEGNPSLSAQARKMIGDPENTVFVSAVSLWEIWLKQSLGKLRLPADWRSRHWPHESPQESKRPVEPHSDGQVEPCVQVPRRDQRLLDTVAHADVSEALRQRA